MNKAVGCIAFSLFLLLLSPAPAQNWYLSTHLDEFVQDISVAASGEVWAVLGETYGEGRIYRYAGGSWSLQTTLFPGGTSKLTAVEALDSAHVWAGGQNGTKPLVYFFNGAAWSRQTEMPGIWLDDIYAADQDNLWAVGGNIYVTANGGSDWAIETEGTYHQLAVDGAGTGDVWTVGGSYPLGNQVLHRHGAWSVQTEVANWATETVRLLDVAVVDALDVWAAGQGGVILHYDGLAWNVSTRVEGQIFQALAARADGQVWAGTQSGRIYRFDGSAWSFQTDLAHSQINGLDASAAEVWVADYSGNIFRFGPATPTPVPPAPWIYDYDGDGTSDIGVFRDSSGLWAIRSLTRAYFGTSGDLPEPSDYDGDGTTDIGIFRASSGLWAVRGLTRAYFGGGYDLPVPGDYDGDGSADVGVFRAANGLWAVRGLTRAYFGGVGDRPLYWFVEGPAFTGRTIAVFREAAGLWAFRGITRFYFGRSGDTPLGGDFSGDGTGMMPAVFRAANGLWAVRGVTRAYFGGSADLPVPAVYQGGRRDDIGIFRPFSGLWAVRGFTRLYFGSPGDVPVTR